MKKFLGYFLTPIATGAFLLVLVIFQPIQWASFRFLGYSAHKKVVDVLNFCLVSTVYLLGNTVTFINKQNLPTDRSIIFLANHQGLLDIPPLIWYLRKYHAKFISKIELTKGIPSISYNLKHGGGANIDRKDPRQSITEIMKLGQRMKENKWSVVIFPEGTRSTDGTVKTFQAAGIATILKKCPNALLVPIAIKDSWKMIQYGMYPLNTFTAMQWEVLAPIEPAGRPVDEVVLEAENMIKAALS
ncbi:lysophospholipid acyltransferase family protein [Mucilaginibacter sp. FT3.2]|uniref:lysophospholipid acyltransferase family protein n=1 Tax=Mucilaginibacter sp. FT3.2 TaxID=2723090 RepID=UPI001621FF3B|nr:lysophospholipid acyltransferase family protein [Mucilaginibacter sp. FT3.2]MBB6231409.1 1-acyl-sn-glycerol-3-phosphate acyltransferase [Mucilaginibacter sp. FT3.2]